MPANQSVIRLTGTEARPTRSERCSPGRSGHELPKTARPVEPNYMSRLHIQCLCGNRLELPPESVGRSLACPSCKAVIRVVGIPPHEDAELDASLIIRRGPKRRGEQIFLAGGQDIVVGKLPGTNLLLSGARVSRTHCRFTPLSNGWRIEDQASTNGVYVNGRKVGARELSHNDRIRIGEYEFLYRCTPLVPRIETSFSIPPESDD